MSTNTLPRKQQSLSSITETLHNSSQDHIFYLLDQTIQIPRETTKDSKITINLASNNLFYII